MHYFRNIIDSIVKLLTKILLFVDALMTHPVLKCYNTFLYFDFMNFFNISYVGVIFHSIHYHNVEADKGNNRNDYL